MDYMIYILAICISAPLILMSALADAKSRRLLGFMILGMYVAVLASEINAILAVLFRDSMDHFHLTITITPVCEEILKALPLLFAITGSDCSSGRCLLALALQFWKIPLF